MNTCRNEGAYRVVVVTGGVLAGQHVRVRIRMPLVACLDHSHPGAFWATLLRLVPRTFSALVANCGIAVPHLHRMRVRFVRIGPARRPERIDAELRAP